MLSFAESLMDYYQGLKPPKNLPENVEVMNPYQRAETFKIASAFYHKYYNDTNKRFICFGINPGRFGAGVTGVPFTDPVRLEKVCGIKNDFEKKAELSSKFIYDMIDAHGGPAIFYSKFYISAVSPLGYVREGINLNYYDIKGFKELFEEYTVTEIKKQFVLGISRKTAFSLGMGQNVKYLNWLNNSYHLFEKIIPLPHPRWIMQYRLKRKEAFIQEYLDTFNNYLQ
ncbi:MAG: uracil-DNA glycosylase family protein [Bacteroidota bacterium]